MLGAVLLCAGCGAGDEPAATVTVTATATVTETVTATPSPSIVEPGPVAVPTPDRIKLTVFEDGCGVIRSETPPSAYENLTWTFRDLDGFQVLGRNAEGETRYRYFQGGTFTVAVEAWVGDHYAPVSNTVTIRC